MNANGYWVQCHRCRRPVDINEVVAGEALVAIQTVQTWRWWIRDTYKVYGIQNFHAGCLVADIEDNRQRRKRLGLLGVSSGVGLVGWWYLGPFAIWGVVVLGLLYRFLPRRKRVEVIPTRRNYE